MKEFVLWLIIIVLFFIIFYQNKGKISEKVSTIISKEKRPRTLTSIFVSVGIICNIAIPIIPSLPGFLKWYNSKNNSSSLYITPLSETNLFNVDEVRLGPFVYDESSLGFVIVEGLIIALVLTILSVSLRHLSFKTNYRQPSVVYGRLVMPISFLFWTASIFMAFVIYGAFSGTIQEVGSLEWYLLVYAVFFLRMMFLFMFTFLFFVLGWLILRRMYSSYFVDASLNFCPVEIESYASFLFTADHPYDSCVDAIAKSFERTLTGIMSLYPANKYAQRQFYRENTTEETKSCLIWHNKSAIGQPKSAVGVMKLSATANNSVEGLAILFLEDYERIIAPEGYQNLLNSLVNHTEPDIAITQVNTLERITMNEVHNLVFSKFLISQSPKEPFWEQIKRKGNSIWSFIIRYKIKAIIGTLVTFIFGILAKFYFF